jgi:hypothetical protein|tara:strand:- start:542 stop:712 length:171 start_codon:yes stop_codon:yes gene_type:complete
MELRLFKGVVLEQKVIVEYKAKVMYKEAELKRFKLHSYKYITQEEWQRVEAFYTKD